MIAARLDLPENEAVAPFPVHDTIAALAADPPYWPASTTDLRRADGRETRQLPAAADPSPCKLSVAVWACSDLPAAPARLSICSGRRAQRRPRLPEGSRAGTLPGVRGRPVPVVDRHRPRVRRCPDEAAAASPHRRDPAVSGSDRARLPTTEPGGPGGRAPAPLGGRRAALRRLRHRERRRHPDLCACQGRHRRHLGVCGLGQREPTVLVARQRAQLCSPRHRPRATRLVGVLPTRARTRTPGDDAVAEDVADPIRAFDAFRASAQRLDAWHASGCQGLRPSGRLRTYTQPTLSRWTRMWATPMYRLMFDPDGRTHRMRGQGLY